jgi:cytochrome oxidase Cu insertion factor (SCO1/SenC/PrrC family)
VQHAPGMVESEPRTMRRRVPTVNRLLALLASLLVPVAAGCASSGPPSIPPWVEAEHVHFEEPSVSEGDVAPDFALQTPDGERTITLSELRGKPVILVFGSFT